MYDKMIAVDKAAPTKEEHAMQGVTKPRCDRDLPHAPRGKNIF